MGLVLVVGVSGIVAMMMGEVDEEEVALAVNSGEMGEEDLVVVVVVVMREVEVGFSGDERRLGAKLTSVSSSLLLLYSVSVSYFIVCMCE